MSAPLIIEVKGIDKIVKSLKDLSSHEFLKRILSQAGDDAAKDILRTEGLQKYPPATAANAPPEPYYIRGRGMQYKTYNDMRSERYGTKFYVTNTIDGYGTIIGNSASYAKYLADEKLQAAHMSRIGWRKLIDVAREKLPEIRRIYDKWIQYAINKLGL